MNQDLLRLRAEDAEDLQIISSCLQDALACVADMRFQSHLHRFAMVVTRFRWERVDRAREGGERIRTGLHFDGVLKVSTQGIDMSDVEGLLPLLAIEARPHDDLYEVELTFAGGAAVRLLAEYIDCHLSDQGEGWPTPNRPEHDVGDSTT